MGMALKGLRKFRISITTFVTSIGPIDRLALGDRASSDTVIDRMGVQSLFGFGHEGAAVLLPGFAINW